MRIIYLDTDTGSASPTDPTAADFGDPYNTWANFKAGESAVTDDITIHVRGSANIDKLTTSGMNYNSLLVIGNANSAAWDNTKSTFEVTNDEAAHASTGLPFEIRFCQMLLNSSDTNTHSVLYGQAAIDFKYGHIRAAGIKTSGEIHGILALAGTGAGGIRIFASFISNLDLGSVSYGARNFSSGNGFEIYQSVLHNCETGIHSNANTKTRNNVLSSNASVYGDFRESNLGDHDYNATTDVNGRGANGIDGANAVTWFVDPDNHDFTLTAAGQSALAGLGEPDPAAGAYDQDITGATFTAPWPIGPLKVQSIPAISAPTVVGSPTQVSASFSTTVTGGTAYIAYDTSGNMTGITSTQIKAGQNANSVAAVGGASITVDESPETILDTGLSLTIGNTYSYAIVHAGADGDSNVLTGSFTVEGLDQSSITDPLVPGSSATSAVVYAGTVQGTVDIIDADSTSHQPVITAWPSAGNGDGDIVFDVPSVFPNDLKPGAVTVRVTKDGGAAFDDIATNLSIDSGHAYATVVSQDVGADAYLDSIPAPVAGDLVAYEILARLVSDDSQTTYTVVVDPSGLTYTLTHPTPGQIVPAGAYYFDFRFYDQQDGTWGAVGRETIIIGDTADLTPDQFDLGADVTGAGTGAVVKRTAQLLGVDSGQDITVNAIGAAEVSLNDTVYVNSITIQNGATFWVRLQASDAYNTAVVGGAEANGVSDTFSVTTRAALLPTITTQPVNQTIGDGGQFTFSVVATNATAYQWRRDGSAVTGATSATYTGTGTLSDTGAQIDCVVTSAEGGTVTTDTVTLTVLANPTGFDSVNAPSISIVDSLDNTAKVYIGRDNSLELQCYESGQAVDLVAATVTRAVFYIGTVALDSQLAPAAFDWTLGNGVVEINYSSMPITPGKHSFKLVLYTLKQPHGIVFNDPNLYTADCVSE